MQASRVRDGVRVRRGRMRRRLPHLSVNRMVPNVLTLLALCAGMTAIRFAIDGPVRIRHVYDHRRRACSTGSDGRLARLLKATSSFGAELDSLADFISFGVAPATVLYLWTMAAWHSVGWVIVLVYAVCCALRLARFNSQLDAEPPPYRADFFSGAPAPAGAGLIMVPMFVSFEWGDWLARSPYLNGLWITGVALLMVSTVPTFSLKRLRIPNQFVIPTLAGDRARGGVFHDRAMADPDDGRRNLSSLDPADRYGCAKGKAALGIAQCRADRSHGDRDPSNRPGC